jgi:enoyl-CoA hydratase/3-hydroxyacyl-CoA dehydrogenase
VEGLALGGGLEYACSADVIVASPKAVMGLPETGIGIYPGLGGTQRPARHIGKELAKYLVFTGRILSAKEAHAIGLVDYVFAPEELESKMRSLISEGKLVPQKGRTDEELPEEWRKIKALFADGNIEDLLSGKYQGSEDPVAAKTAKMLASKAPIALHLANRIMDEGYDKPVAEATKLELEHCKEIFSTQDALTGLTSIGKGKPAFEGK